jgi:N-acetylmuramoyl-L-alanine amidase
MTAKDSRALALELQKGMVSALRHEGVHTRDLGVKGSLFYVLLGARMPAVLIETAFLSNPDEARLLGDPAHRHVLAEAITQAIAARLATPMVAAAP